LKKTDDRIDFISFARSHIEKEKKKGKNPGRIYTAINSIEDFALKKQKLPALYIDAINYSFLTKYESYLRTERTVVRKNQFLREVTVRNPPMSDCGIASLTDIRTVFNAARNEFNDEDSGVIRIAHYPFKKYKMPKVPETEKRNLPAEMILKIINAEEEDLMLARTVLARDVFVLSFFFVWELQLRFSGNEFGRFVLY
jgi:hypothetical protein